MMFCLRTTCRLPVFAALFIAGFLCSRYSSSVCREFFTSVDLISSPDPLCEQLCLGRLHDVPCC